MGKRCQRRSARVVPVVATESAAGSAAVVVATRILAGSAAMVVVCVVAPRGTGGAVLSDGSAVSGGTGGKQ